MQSHALQGRSARVSRRLVFMLLLVILSSSVPLSVSAQPVSSLPGRLPAQVPPSGSNGPQVLLLPRCCSAQYDYIWRYADGIWTSIDVPISQIAWKTLVADPADPQRWLLLANTEHNSYTVVGETLRRTGGTYPLWYTEDAGDNWEPVLLPADSNSTGWGIEPSGLAFDTTQPGAWRLSARSSNGTWLWRGQNETAPAPVLLVQPLYCYYDFLTLVPGLDEETALYANTLNSCGSTWQKRGLAFTGATGDTVTVSGNTVFSPSNSEAPDLKSMDRLPGTSRAIVGIENRSTGDLYATADYRTTQVSQQYAAGAGWVTAAQDGIYIGGRTGLLAVPDVLGAPTVNSVVGITAGVPVGFVRADRQTQSAVAALSSDKQTLYLRPEVGAAWQAITIPVSQIDPYYIYPDHFEVIIW